MEKETLTLKGIVDREYAFGPGTRQMSNLWFLTKDNRYRELQIIQRYLESRLPRHGFSHERAEMVSLGALELIQNSQLNSKEALARYCDVCFSFWMGNGYVHMATKNRGTLDTRKVLASSAGLGRIGQKSGRGGRGVHLMLNIFDSLEFDVYDGNVEVKAEAYAKAH